VSNLKQNTFNHGGDPNRKEVMVMENVRLYSKSELERSVLEMIRVARRLIDLKKERSFKGRDL
jgi:hypothetical protein